MRVVAPNQAVRRRIGIGCLVAAAATAVGAAVVAVTTTGTGRIVGTLVLLAYVGGFVRLGRANLRRSRFSVLVDDDVLSITDATGTTHTWATADVGVVHHYERVQARMRFPWMAVRDPAGGLLVDLPVESAIDIEELADATATAGIYTTRQPGVAVNVVSHNPPGRPDTIAVAPLQSAFLLRFALLAGLPFVVLALPGSLLLGSGNDLGVVLVLVGTVAVGVAVVYLLRNATGITFSSAGVHPGAGIALRHAIERERIRSLRVDETWVGTTLHVDLVDGRVLSFRRQVGLTAEQVRLAATTVGIPVT